MAEKQCNLIKNGGGTKFDYSYSNSISQAVSENATFDMSPITLRRGVYIFMCQVEFNSLNVGAYLRSMHFSGSGTFINIGTLQLPSKNGAENFGVIRITDETETVYPTYYFYNAATVINEMFVAIRQNPSD